MSKERQSKLTFRFVIASPRQEDLIDLTILLAGSAWAPVHVRTCGDAGGLIRTLRVPIVLCDLGLEGRPWQQSLRRLLATQPTASVVFLSNAQDRVRLCNVVRSGGFGLLARPFERERVFNSLLSAYCRHVLYRLSLPVARTA